MNIGSSDERGDWARKFLSNEEFNELVNRGDKFIAFEAEEVFFDFPVLTVNDCLNIIDRWDDATVKGNDFAFEFFHDAIQTFIDYLIVALEDIGVIVVEDTDNVLLEDDIEWLESDNPDDEE